MEYCLTNALMGNFSWVRKHARAYGRLIYRTGGWPPEGVERGEALFEGVEWIQMAGSQFSRAFELVNPGLRVAWPGVFGRELSEQLDEHLGHDRSIERRLMLAGLDSFAVALVVLTGEWPAPTFDLAAPHARRFEAVVAARLLRHWDAFVDLARKYVRGPCAEPCSIWTRYLFLLAAGTEGPEAVLRHLAGLPLADVPAAIGAIIRNDGSSWQEPGPTSRQG